MLNYYFVFNIPELKKNQYCLTFSWIYSQAGNYGLVEFGIWYWNEIKCQEFSSSRSYSFLKLPKYRNFLKIFWKFWKYSSKYQLFSEHTPGFKTQVWISTNSYTRGKLNFRIIKRFECNRTSNSNAKYHLNWNIHVPHHRSGRGQAFSKTLRFGMLSRR